MTFRKAVSSKTNSHDIFILDSIFGLFFILSLNFEEDEYLRVLTYRDIGPDSERLVLLRKWEIRRMIMHVSEATYFGT